MSVRQIELSEPLDRFVEEQVGSGAYPNAEELIRTGLTRMMKTTRRNAQLDTQREARFYAMLEEARQESARGEGVRIDDLEVMMAEIAAEADRS